MFKHPGTSEPGERRGVLRSWRAQRSRATGELFAYTVRVSVLLVLKQPVIIITGCY